MHVGGPDAALTGVLKDVVNKVKRQMVQMVGYLLETLNEMANSTHVLVAVGLPFNDQCVKHGDVQGGVGPLMNS